MKNKRRFWTQEEINFLKENYKNMKCKNIAKKLGRSYCSIFAKVWIINLSKNEKPKSWTQEEINFLKENYKNMTYKEISKKLSKKYWQVSIKANILNLKSERKGFKKGYKPWCKGLTKQTDERLKKKSLKQIGVSLPKTSKTLKRLYKEGKINLVGCAKKSKENPSWQSGKNHPLYGKKNKKASKYMKNGGAIKARLGNYLKPNKPEKFLIKLFKQLNLSYKYVGDCSFLIENKNPDFINCNGQKKIIEHFGDYWHNLKGAKARDKERLQVYKKYGYKTLIIWEHELKNLNQVINKIKRFDIL